ncbi:UNVERIFIED_CONTAM: Mitogen-activated protein kinase kinase [Sesamum angustifolium]|uniref:Mitogen-activated protein kinase kinase n=1 Tax=Sesamum angustifolium TaxID=2727405 RepID=A0AAW2PW80_9LAMI
MEANEAVNFTDLSMKALIKEEESGERVYEVVNRVTGATYGMKEFSSHYDSNSRAEISREIQIVKQLDHPNLVKCYEVFFIGDMIYLLFEHMDRGSLVGADIRSESALASVAYQVLLGLAYLHENRISHNDVRPSNIFVNSMEEVKVLYLGRSLSKTPLVVSGSGAIHDEFSWDLWNVGSSILKLFKDSYLGFRDRDIEKANYAKRFNLLRSLFEEPSHSLEAQVQKPSTELWTFLACCMHTDLSQRWTAKELVGHPFFIQLHLRTLEKVIKLLSTLVQFVEVRIIEAETSASLSDPLSYVTEEQLSPKKKKPKISVEDKDSTYMVETPKDPAQPVPLVQLGLHHTLDYLERCIQHCSLFLPDYEFGKDKLVQLWIAEACIEVEAPKRMEDVANSYFDILVHEEVIIHSNFDKLYRQAKYKVNASKASTWNLQGGNYLRIEEGNLGKISGEALHLTWHCKRLDRTLSDALKNFKQLRTLLVLEDCGAVIKQLPSDIFLGLKLLRTLDLSRTHISELPGSIGTVESLRYLDVSETPIKRLPESTDRLLFLQTLKLRGCLGLFALPRGLRRLVNLRHLDLDIISQLKSMPTGMGNLSKLQTLKAFIVGKNDGCGIGELKNMNAITGSFCISRLENVTNAEEAKQAVLADKQRIDKLELRWHDHGNDSSQDTAEILECLQPHFHLKELEIISFSGSKLPSWISNPSFTKIASITLYKCINCDILPSMGELPSLQTLHIVEMKMVRDINTLFCRTHGTRGLNAFPLLEKLTLDNMLNLEEWTGIQDGDFPCLRHLSIRYCPKLSVLPSMSYFCSLQHLEVSHCMQLISSTRLVCLVIDSCDMRGTELVDLWNLFLFEAQWFDIPF